MTSYHVTVGKWYAINHTMCCFSLGVLCFKNTGSFKTIFLQTLKANGIILRARFSFDNWAAFVSPGLIGVERLSENVIPRIKIQHSTSKMCAKSGNFDWQTDLFSVSERIKYAHSNSLFCDIQFSVLDSNDTEVILPATKYILAVTSPVFAAMFYSKLAESKSTIELPDCTSEGLKEFLRYAHSDEIHLTGRNVVDVLYIAEKYIVPPLVKKCEEYIQNNLQPEDVFFVLPKILTNWNKTLVQRCWDLITVKTQRALSSPSFLDISKHFLCQVLRRNKLAIEEILIFQAVDKWVSKRIQEKGMDMNGKVKRAILGEQAIRLIRFPLMTEKEFAQYVLPSRVLKMHEVTELVQTFNSFRPVYRNFCSDRRNGIEKDFVMPPDRFESVDPFAFNGMLTSSVDFEVNQTVQLVGARLFGSECTCFEVDFSISEIEQKSGKYESKCHFISTVETGDKIDDNYYALDIIMKHPIQLFPGSQYRIGFHMKGLHKYIGSKGRNEVHFQDITIKYKNPTLGSHQYFRSFRGSKPEGGQIQALLLKRIDSD